MSAQTEIEAAFVGASTAFINLSSQEETAKLLLRQAMTAMLPKMSVSRDTLRRVIFVQDAQLLQSLFTAHGSGPYAEIQKCIEKRVSLTPLYAAQKASALRVLHDAGLPIIDEHNTLRCNLISNPDPLMLELFLIDAGCSNLLLHHDAMQSIRRFSGENGRILARAYLSLSSDDQRVVVAQIVKQLCTLMRAKPLAFVLSSNFDVAGIFETNVKLKFLQEPIRTLVEQTRSGHARIALKSNEPDFLEMMSRPNDAAFFGLTQKDIQLWTGTNTP